MRTISIRLDDSTDAALTAHCERHGVTQTDAVKAAIEHLTARHQPTPAELAAELGLIGGFNSGIADLARNRAAYMRERLVAQRTRDALPSTGAKAPARRKRGPATA